MSKVKTAKAKTTEAPVVNITTPVVNVTENTQPQVAEGTAETKQLGRPANPDSNRQKQLAARQAAIEAGNAPKRGRKPVEGSARQAKLARQAELRAAGLLTGKKGRPVVPGSKHQEKIAARQAMIAANGGVPMKPGRPPYTAEQKAAAKAIADAKKAEAKAAAAVVVAPVE